MFGDRATKIVRPFYLYDLPCVQEWENRDREQYVRPMRLYGLMFEI